MKFRYLVYFFFLCLTTLGFSQKRPNIVFIMSDDHATQALSAYGSKMIQTPHLDQLAKEGTLFTQAFCTNSICGPSRAVILTGKYSHLNRYIVNETTAFDSSQTTFPKLFRKAGYQTALIGKWHLGSDPTGFDYWNILPGQGEYFDPMFNEMGNTKRVEGYVTEIIAEKTVEWLRNRDTSKPFLLISQHKAPHSNFSPSSKYEHEYDDVVFPEPPTLFDDFKTRSLAAKDNNMRLNPHLKLQYMNNDILKIPEGLGEKEQTRWLYQWYMRRYMACVRSVDDAVGKVMQTLRELGLEENTIVIYTSDQGFFLGEHGWYDKRFMYEESLKIPLIVRYPPTIPAGRVEDRFALNLDFAQTLLEFAGIEQPEDMQGRSLKPLLENKPIAHWRNSVYYHYYEYPGWHYVKRHYGVRTTNYKLIHYYHDIDAWELYDLHKDPHEINNVFSNPEYASIKEKLLQELEKLQHQYGDSLELAHELIKDFPHGALPSWGKWK